VATHRHKNLIVRNLPSSIAVIIALLATLCLSSASYAAVPSRPWVSGEYRRGDFELVRGARAADIIVSPEDFKVVQIAADDLAADIERVTGRRPSLRAEASGLSAHAVLVGTLGSTPTTRSRRAPTASTRGCRASGRTLSMSWSSTPCAGRRSRTAVSS
jgi:hypothetical protein